MSVSYPHVIVSGVKDAPYWQKAGRTQVNKHFKFYVDFKETLMALPLIY